MKINKLTHDGYEYTLKKGNNGLDILVGLAACKNVSKVYNYSARLTI